MNSLFDTNEVWRDEIEATIRYMSRKDINEVLKIENKCFEFAWNEEDFMSCMRLRNCIGMVAESQGRIVGYMLYVLEKGKIHLLNVAMLPEFRRKGIGKQLVAKIIAKLGSQRRTRIVLEVRETNLPAQIFFRSLGFLATGIMRDFHEATDEDAYEMVYKHGEFEPILPLKHRKSGHVVPMPAYDHAQH